MVATSWTILFTIFVLGGTTKPLLDCMGVERESSHGSSSAPRSDPSGKLGLPGLAAAAAADGSASSGSLAGTEDDLTTREGRSAMLASMRRDSSLMDCVARIDAFLREGFLPPKVPGTLRGSDESAREVAEEAGKCGPVACCAGGGGVALASSSRSMDAEQGGSSPDANGFQHVDESVAAGGAGRAAASASSAVGDVEMT